MIIRIFECNSCRMDLSYLFSGEKRCVSQYLIPFILGCFIVEIGTRDCGVNHINFDGAVYTLFVCGDNYIYTGCRIIKKIHKHFTIFSS